MCIRDRSALTGADIEVVTGRGGGLTDEGFARKKDVLRRALTRRAVDKDDVLDAVSYTHLDVYKRQAMQP